MIQESLHVSHLGPLRDVTLTLRPITVIMGASGSGKSLLLKVLAMMRHLCRQQMIKKMLKESGVKKLPFKVRKDSYLRFADIAHLMTPDTRIEYSVEWEGGHCRLAFAEMNNPDTEGDGYPFMKIAFVSDTRNVISTWARKGSAFQSKVFDNYFAETYALWDAALSEQELKKQRFDYLGLGIAVGKTEFGARKIELLGDSGNKTLFERAASGQRSAIPLSLIVRYLVDRYDFKAAETRHYLSVLIESMTHQAKDVLEDAVRQLRLKSFRGHCLAVHIEEPELSLDPQTQVGLLEDLMATFERAHSMDVSAVFTTHSPYWVVALNTLIDCPEYRWAAWDKVTGYILEDGTAKCVRDEENRLLMSPGMDAATEALDERYDRRLDERFGDANHA